MPDGSLLVDVLRAEDLLSLRFEFVNRRVRKEDHK
jgi:hypothetical protein